MEKQNEPNQPNQPLENELIILLNGLVEAEGIAREPTEQAFIIQGNTGAGKTALTYDIGGKALIGYLNAESGERRVRAADLIEKMLICEDQLESITSIPNRIIRGETPRVSIWDTPGYADTRSIICEVLNTFYVRKLFEVDNQQIKLILAVTDHDLFLEKTAFTKTIKIFTASLTAVESIKDHVALVITKAKPTRTREHVIHQIKEFIRTTSLSPEEEMVLKYFIGTEGRIPIHLFHKPKFSDEPTEEILPSSQIFEQIAQSTSYLTGDLNGLFKQTVSPNSKDSVRELKKMIEGNILLIISTTQEGIKETRKLLADSKEKAVFEKHSWKQFLPKNYYQNLKRSQADEENTQLLPEIFQLEELLEILTKAEEEDRTRETQLKWLERNYAIILDCLKKYCSKDNASLLGEYKFILQQQISLLNYFIELADEPEKKFDEERIKLAASRDLIEKELDQRIKDMNVKPNQTPKYYKTAIYFLNKKPEYKEDDKCKERMVLCYVSLGQAYESINHKQSLQYYLDAVELNHQDPSSTKALYKMGNLLYAHHQYKLAREWFELVNDNASIRKCWKMLSKTNTGGVLADIYVDKGDFMLKIGMFEGARESYDMAYHVRLQAGELDELEPIVKRRIESFVRQAEPKRQSDTSYPQLVAGQFTNFETLQTSKDDLKKYLFPPQQ